MSLKISGDAFRAKLAFINRKVVPRLEPDDVFFRNKQIHSALYAAIRAVRGYLTVDHTAALPAAVRFIVEMRAILLDDLFQILNFAHFKSSAREPTKTFSLALGKLAYASPRITRLHRGQ